MKDEFYAHSKDGKPREEWHRLEDHLKKVAEMARNFANDFNAGDWGYLAGLWHDLGKYSGEFQDKIKKDIDAHIESLISRVDHSTAGAQHAIPMLDIIGHLLAYVVAGHHSGLLNGRDTGACQEARLRKAIPLWEHGLQFLPKINKIEPPIFLRCALTRKNAFSVAFFVRMIFSCLIDADFLDTEAFMNAQQAALRLKWPDNILNEMDSALTEFVQQLDLEDTVVNRQRALVREACLKAAEENPGLFSLTVPTGGGKTLSSLAFALRHAVKHGLQRVIYVIPLTSIIEQNADVFREAMKSLADKLGRDLVVEHHSNLDPEKETAFNRLAAENWDAPLIVTTSVQFYESLFSNKTSRCRKLHRLARSVIILDEAQTLPVDYLKPCLLALQELTTNYRTSIVICTATQPAIERREGFEIGLQKPFEIIPNPVELYHQLHRVRVEDIGSQSDQEICRRMQDEPQVLCIVNTRLHARKLFETIEPGDDHFHLSGNMCPAHRAEKLNQIRGHLNQGHVCRVVSTQVVEAGVDVDFPVVYRSLAGLDSIAQAAGRCNRNGRLPQKGNIYIFRSEHTRSERFFSDTAQCAGQILTLYRDILNLEAIQHYFQLYYWDQSARWDEKRIMDNFSMLNERQFPFNFGFTRTAEVFQLIDETRTCPVIIPWRESGRRLCERLRSIPTPTLEIQRELQRYVVPIPRRIWEKHVGTDIQLIHEGISVLVSPEVHYSEETGLNLEAEEPGAIFA
ncbi:MAG: CRISPR-associated helicase Cas3' [Thermodesulfobacteriota bacterium]